MSNKPLNPTEIRTVRFEALRLAVESEKIQGHGAAVLARAHYFAHYLVDDDRNTACDTVTCPYQIPLVPSNHPSDAA